ncbi:MAG: purM [Pseudonocardiales bacterium]|nr:purM [Pseudonocardiales bacterium]
MSSPTYAGAGVDIVAGERAVELMKAAVGRTKRPEVVGGLGGFAGLFRLDVSKYKQPLLATSTDGVGTKIAIARAADRHDTIGIDMVAMVVDDLVVVGAEPLFLTDYIATGKVVPEKIATIVGGIARGCEQAGCTLIGGETAEHPGVMEPDDYDVSGAAVGVVEEEEALGSHLVRADDVLIGMHSSGLHSNGYSMVRHVLFDRTGMSLDDKPTLLNGTALVDELLVPTRIYALDCLALAEAGLVHAFSHVTGGGLAGNLARVLPDHIDAAIDRATWRPQPIFTLLQQAADVPVDQMELTFNMGIGMVAVVPAGAVEDALALCAQRGVPATIIGSLRDGTGLAHLAGSHA